MSEIQITMPPDSLKKNDSANVDTSKNPPKFKVDPKEAALIHVNSLLFILNRNKESLESDPKKKLLPTGTKLEIIEIVLDSMKTTPKETKETWKQALKTIYELTNPQYGIPVAQEQKRVEAALKLANDLKTAIDPPKRKSKGAESHQSILANDLNAAIASLQEAPPAADSLVRVPKTVPKEKGFLSNLQNTYSKEGWRTIKSGWTMKKEKDEKYPQVVNPFVKKTQEQKPDTATASANLSATQVALLEHIKAAEESRQQAQYGGPELGTRIGAREIYADSVKKGSKTVKETELPKASKTVPEFPLIGSRGTKTGPEFPVISVDVPESSSSILAQQRASALRDSTGRVRSDAIQAAYLAQQQAANAPKAGAKTLSYDENVALDAAAEARAAKARELSGPRRGPQDRPTLTLAAEPAAGKKETGNKPAQTKGTNTSQYWDLNSAISRATSGKGQPAAEPTSKKAAQAPKEGEKGFIGPTQLASQKLGGLDSSGVRARSILPDSLGSTSAITAQNITRSKEGEQQVPNENIRFMNAAVKTASESILEARALAKKEKYDEAASLYETAIISYGLALGKANSQSMPTRAQAITRLMSQAKAYLEELSPKLTPKLSYEQQVAADAAEEARVEQVRLLAGPRRLGYDEPKPSFTQQMQDRLKANLTPVAKIAQATAPKASRVDNRAAASLKMDNFSAAVQAGVKTLNHVAVTEGRVQMELTSIKSYINQFFKVSPKALNEPQMRTATELAIVSSWIGTGNTRDFMLALSKNGFTLNANGKFVGKDGQETELKDLLATTTVTPSKYVPTQARPWLAKPLAAIVEFEKLSPSTSTSRQELISVATELFGQHILPGAEANYKSIQIWGSIKRLSEKQVTVLSTQYNDAKKAGTVTPEKFEELLTGVRSMSTESIAEFEKLSPSTSTSRQELISVATELFGQHILPGAELNEKSVRIWGSIKHLSEEQVALLSTQYNAAKKAGTVTPEIFEGLLKEVRKITPGAAAASGEMQELQRKLSGIESDLEMAKEALNEKQSELQQMPRQIRTSRNGMSLQKEIFDLQAQVKSIESQKEGLQKQLDGLKNTAPVEKPPAQQEIAQVPASQISIVTTRLGLKLGEVPTENRAGVLEGLYTLETSTFRSELLSALEKKTDADKISWLLNPQAGALLSPQQIFDALSEVRSPAPISKHYYFLALGTEVNGKPWHSSLKSFGAKEQKDFLTLFEKVGIISLQRNKDYVQIQGRFELPMEAGGASEGMRLKMGNPTVELIKKNADAASLKKTGDAEGTTFFDSRLKAALDKGDAKAYIYTDTTGKKHTVADVLCDIAQRHAEGYEQSASAHKIEQRRSDEEAAAKAPQEQVPAPDLKKVSSQPASTRYKSPIRTDTDVDERIN